MTGLDPKQLLQHFQVPSAGVGEAIYLIGTFERRVTFYSQQVRALNLAYALFETGRLHIGAKVAVIGGGAAGVTAALGLAHLGAEVELVERADVLLPLQQGCRTRWIHPHIYDWPMDGAEDPNAGLPLANWRAGYAHDVATELSRAFESAPNRAAIHLTLLAHVSRLIVKSDKPRLSWQGMSPNGRAITKSDVQFDAVIVAVGFGLEDGTDTLPMSSYWRNDDLDQPVLRPGPERMRCLVSGNGDGGLIEVLRLRMRWFRLEDLHARLSESLRPSDLENLIAQLRRWEAEASKRGDAWLWERYDSLELPNALTDELTHRMLRTDTKVWLAAARAPITERSAVLNRLWVALLIKHDDHTKWVQSATLSVTKQDSGYTVRFADPHAAKVPLLFERVIVRHGPTSALSGALQWIADSCRAELAARNALDATRTPFWSPVAFARRGASHEEVVPAMPAIGERHRVNKTSGFDAIVRAANVAPPAATSPTSGVMSSDIAATVAPGVGRMDTTPHIVGLSFSDSFRADPKSVELVAQVHRGGDGAFALTWSWHASIREPSDRVTRKWVLLSAEHGGLGGYLHLDHLENSAPAFALPLLRSVKPLMRADQSITRAFTDMLSFLANESLTTRTLAIGSFATFAALEMVARLRVFEGELFTDDNLPILNLFPDQPASPTPWSLHRVPYRSHVGANAFGEPRWVLARVQFDDGPANYFLLPEACAREALAKHHGITPTIMATWIVPQWFLQRYSGLPGWLATVTVLFDELGRSHADAAQAPPWSDEPELEERLHASTVLVGAEIHEIRPDWYVTIMPHDTTTGRRTVRRARLSGARILWLYDDHRTYELEASYLELLGAEVVHARSLPLALAIFAGRKIDLVISGWHHSDNDATSKIIDIESATVAHGMLLVFYTGDRSRMPARLSDGTIDNANDLFRKVEQLLGARGGENDAPVARLRDDNDTPSASSTVATDPSTEA